MRQTGGKRKWLLTLSVANTIALVQYVTDVLQSAIAKMRPKPKAVKAQQYNPPPVSKHESNLIQRKRALLEQYTHCENRNGIKYTI
jgi:hypothetical protein